MRNEGLKACTLSDWLFCTEIKLSSYDLMCQGDPMSPGWQSGTWSSHQQLQQQLGPENVHSSPMTATLLDLLLWDHTLWKEQCPVEGHHSCVHGGLACLLYENNSKINYKMQMTSGVPAESKQKDIRWKAPPGGRDIVWPRFEFFKREWVWK